MANKDISDVVKVLILGVENVGKKHLADAILEESSETFSKAFIELELLISTNVQPMDERDELKIGLIVVLLDLTMKNSDEIMSQLRMLSMDVFGGKLCFVLCGVKHFKAHQLNFDIVMEEVRKYQSPVFYGMCKDPDEVKVVASKIVHLLQLVSGGKSHLRASIFSENMVPKLLDGSELE